MSKKTEFVIGVLALQGAVIEHINHLQDAVKQGYSNYKFSFIEVKTKDQLESCSALIIPGGESTSISLIAERTNMLKPLMEFVKSEKPIWGTCAGLIMLSKELVNGNSNQKLLGGMDIQVKRNVFGRNIHSFESKLNFSNFIDGLNDFPIIFIRAPVISKILDNSLNNIDKKDESETIRSTNDYINQYPIEILHTLPNNLIVAVRQGNKLGTSFHPELTNDCRFHKWFIDEFVIKSV